MNARELLARLEGASSTRNGWIARCPAHPDRNPSLSIREESNRILLHCFAGCSVDAICDALGITVRDLFAERRLAQKPKPLIVRDAEKQIAPLRTRLTPHDHERDVTVVLASQKNLDPAIARALALAVEGELVQIVLKQGAR